jgi:phosphotransferase system HPr (HPr) family protein
VAVANPHGLHMRPAAAFAETAKRFRAAVTVTHGDKTADGKSSWELIMLVAGPGAELTVEACGADDAAAALDTLKELLLAASDEAG